MFNPKLGYAPRDNAMSSLGQAVYGIFQAQCAHLLYQHVVHLPTPLVEPNICPLHPTECWTEGVPVDSTTEEPEF